MRFQEILNEASLSNSELRKHAGKYLSVLIRKIKEGEPLEIVPEKQEKYGEKVIVNPSAANDIIKAYFGVASGTNIPSTENMDLADNGDIIPVSDPSKVVLRTADGDELVLSSLQKTPEYKSGKDFNAGDVGEAALGAAVYAVFQSRKQQISEEDIFKVFAQLAGGELIGKNNLKGTVSGASKNDKIHFHLALNTTSYKAVVGAGTSAKPHPQILGAVRSAVQFGNQNPAVKVALQKIISDNNSNQVIVNADGVTDQSIKADLFLDIDGTTINLLSLKAGDVKQFGQSSGYNFDAIERFFQESFGVNVDNRLKNEFVDGDPVTSFEAIHKVYNQVAKSIEAELAGDNSQQEATFIERLYNGIKHHATGGEDGTSMVILKTTPNAPGYTELEFGDKLRKAMDNIDLYLKYEAPGQRKPAKIEIWGRGENGGDAMFLRLRSNFKSEGKGYVRNIVEMGKLLKVIAQLEQRQMATKLDFGKK